MREIKAFNERRAEIYWWLSSLFVHALSDKELLAYHRPEIRNFLAGLGENATLELAINLLRNRLDQLENIKDAQPLLASDFFRLFQDPVKALVPPRASVYINEPVPPAHQIMELMEKKGIPAHSRPEEPVDHLASELDFLGNMIIRSNEFEKPEHMDEALTEQQWFIEKHLLNWLPDFAEKCSEYDTFGFYASIAALLVSFCQLDCSYLSGEG